MGLYFVLFDLFLNPRDAGTPGKEPPKRDQGVTDHQNAVLEEMVFVLYMYTLADSRRC